jgi:hypothetical protein
MRRHLVSLVLVALLLLASVARRLPRDPALAQTGGGYDLEWNAFGSAGDQLAAGSSYQLGFTLAQDASPLVSAGSSYQLVQGFWAGGGFPPTAVTLVGFWIEVRGNTLVACWETASEMDTLGFNVLRSDSDEPGSFARLNGELIPGQLPGSPAGASYEWLDAGVEAGQTYLYLLEDVDVYGQATHHGPVSATLPPATLYPFYLPLVNR